MPFRKCVEKGEMNVVCCRVKFRVTNKKLRNKKSKRFHYHVDYLLATYL